MLILSRAARSTIRFVRNRFARNTNRFGCPRDAVRSTTRFVGDLPSPAALLVALTLLPGAAGATPRPVPLGLEVYTADAGAFGVTSTLLYGPTEAVVIDAQFRNSDAEKLADRIAAVAPGRRLKAILITHPHPDHYFGTAALLRRFPGTPIYMSAAGIAELEKTVAGKIAFWSGVLGNEIPQEVPTPQPVPARLTVDGSEIDLVSDVQGDVQAKTNNYVWVPGLRALIAGDLVYAGTHVWLADSSPASRAGWRASLRDLARRQAKVVVAGHKATPQTADAPADIAFVDRYIGDFDAARASAKTAGELEAAMKQRYPSLALENVLGFAVKAAFPN